MDTITVNQDYLLALLANNHKFIVAGIYSNGLMLKAATTKVQKESESDRMLALKCQLDQLGITYTLCKLESRQGQIELQIFN